MVLRRCFAAGLVVLAACAGAAANSGRIAGCKPAPAILDLAVARGRPLVSVRINGRPVHLLIDTGASHSSVTEETARALDLRRDPTKRTRIRGTGGVLESVDVVADTLEFGGRKFTSLRLAVHPLPGTEGLQPPVGGLLGADLLATHEVDLDVAGRRLTLWQPAAGCPPVEPDWTYPEPRLLPTERRGSQFVLQVTLAGQPVPALLDSGAGSSGITTSAARRLGVTEALLEAAPRSEARGADGAARQVRYLRFRELQVGPDTFRGVMIGVSDIRLPAGIEMLLGLDYLRPRRIFFSYATGRVWVGRSGGLSPPARPAAPPPPRTAPGPPAARPAG